MNRLFVFLMVSVFYLASVAQVKNYAVDFDGNSDINFNKIDELNGLSKYTVQFWICPSEWMPNASVFKRGAAATLFEACLGANEGTITYRIGDKSIDIQSDKISVNSWVQLSLLVDESKLAAYVNGEEVEIPLINVPLPIPDSDSEFRMGQGFKGQIDEFRIWSTSLDVTEYLTKDTTVKGYLLWDNTINKFHPDYSSLLVYYKFDQDLCENIVDYKFRHHGIMSGNTHRVEVKNNPLFKYRIMSAYTEFSRFTDTGTDRDKYLLCNDLVALAASLNDDGSASVSLPFDEGKLVGGASYIEAYEGRDGGMLALDGTGKMNVGTTAMNSSDTYSFFTWLYIDRWVENAFLFKKEKDEYTGISLRLGKEENTEVVLRVNGNEYRYKAAKELVVGKWIHLGFSTYDATSLERTFVFACNKKKLGSYPYSYPETIKPWTLPLTDLADVEVTVGENFVGKLDETMIWNSSNSRDGIYSFADNGANMPGFGKNVGTNYAFYAGCYWKYDKPDNPGYDYFSYKEYLNIMRSAYTNYRGFKIRLSVSGGSDWKNTIANAKKRERFATEMADIINNDDQLDGVDFDLEWPGYNGQDAIWTNYGKLMTLLRSKLKEDKILTISPHTVSYWFPKEDMKSVDYFLFQNYGPAKAHFTYESFPAAYNKFLAWGYPNEKIVMSFAASTSRKSVDGVEVAGAAGAPVRIHQVGAIGPDDDFSNGYSFTGFNQTRWRSEQVKKQGLGGIMCWSLNIDFPDTNHPLSLFKASAYAISSNVDTLVTRVDLAPVGIEQVNVKKSDFMIYPNPSEGEVNLLIPQGEKGQEIYIYSNAGKVVRMEKVVAENTYNYKYGKIEPGVYILKLTTMSGKQYTKTMIVR